MAQPDEMRRLTQHFLEAHDDRIAAVATIRTVAAQELAEFHADQQAMAAELRAHMDEQEAGRQAQAAEDVRGRVEYVEELRGNTAALLKELDAAQQAMAAELRAHMGEQETARQAQAMEYMDELRSDVSAMRNELQAAQSEARRVWNSFLTIIQQRRRRKAAPPPPPPPPPVEEAPPVAEKVPIAEEAPPVAEEVAPDDLTTIRGIGPSMQQRLNEAGIDTYAQLAASTEEQLREALGETAGRLAKVEEWIEQARGLTG